MKVDIPPNPYILLKTRSHLSPYALRFFIFFQHHLNPPIRFGKTLFQTNHRFPVQYFLHQCKVCVSSANPLEGQSAYGVRHEAKASSSFPNSCLYKCLELLLHSFPPIIQCIFQSFFKGYFWLPASLFSKFSTISNQNRHI